jgi:hypothetical protein
VLLLVWLLLLLLLLLLRGLLFCRLPRPRPVMDVFIRLHHRRRCASREAKRASEHLPAISALKQL